MTEYLIRGVFVFSQQLELKYLKQSTVIKIGSALLTHVQDRIPDACHPGSLGHISSPCTSVRLGSSWMSPHPALTLVP